MLSKEEIENMKLDILNLHHMLGKKPSISKNAIKNALKYIDQLESDQQKLIEKLEEDKIELIEELKYNITKREARMQLNLVNKYLEIVKGE